MIRSKFLSISCSCPHWPDLITPADWFVVPVSHAHVRLGRFDGERVHAIGFQMAYFVFVRATQAFHVQLIKHMLRQSQRTQWS